MIVLLMLVGNDAMYPLLLSGFEIYGDRWFLWWEERA
jgi:hypothetical protein